MKIVIYARYSSNNQTEQSIEGQLKTCYDHADRMGYTVIGEYIDRAASATNDNRPEFQKMLRDSNKRQFEAVLVYQFDRFARNRFDSANNKQKLHKNGVKVLSARENITDDASGVLLESMVEGMAEYFSKELSQKVTRGLRISAEKCQYTGGTVALGYRIENKSYVIDNETSVIVKKIFEMYLKRNSMADIIRYLNNKGMKTSKGNEYNKNSIRKILTNDIYRGVFKYSDIVIPDGVPRLIDEETFQAVQIQMAKNKKAPARNKALGDQYILTTKLFCGKCGSPMVGYSGVSHTSKPYSYYCCKNQKRRICKKKSIRKDRVEPLVVDALLKSLSTKYLGSVAKKIATLSHEDGNGDVIKYVEKKLKENKVALENLVGALEQGKSIDLISEQIEKRQAERQDLEMELAREKIQSPALTEEEILFFFNRFKNGDKTNPKFCASLVDMFVEKILLFEDENGSYLEIYCRASDKSNKIPIDEPKGSSMGDLVRVLLCQPQRFPCHTNGFKAVNNSIYDFERA
ncbi:MAG: recombinase family protein [Eubacteriales bacterium]